jgi:hypothetical protein
MAELKKGMQFITNKGVTVEFTGGHIFRDVKTGKKYLDDVILKDIKYMIKDSATPATNEEPLDTPAMFGPTGNALEATNREEFHSGGIEEPLDVPKMDFSGQGEVKKNVPSAEL